MHFNASFLKINTILILFLGVLFIVTLFNIFSQFFYKKNISKRIRSVLNKKKELKFNFQSKLSKENKNAKSKTIKYSDSGVAGKIINKYNMLAIFDKKIIEKKLEIAGFRGEKPLNFYYIFKITTPIIFCFITFLYTIFNKSIPQNTKIIYIIGGFLLGFYAPSLYINNIIGKRKKKILYAFSDALDLLLICVESGMSVESAIQKVASEISYSCVELAEEFILLSAELSYLPSRQAAYEGLARRTDLENIKAFTMALSQAERYGTPLGSALRTQAKENREFRMHLLEKKAAQLPVKLTLPMAFFILPSLFVVILTPIFLMAVKQHY